MLTAQGEDIVRAIGSTPDDPFSLIYLTLISAIGNAERQIFLTNAYFVPDPQLLKALTDAAGRGVAVTMILPGFMSRWITRLRWANATPSQARLKSFRRSRKLKFREKQYSSIGSPATNSIAMYGMPSSVVPVSKILAIFGCSRLDWISISR